MNRLTPAFLMSAVFLSGCSHLESLKTMAGVPAADKTPAVDNEAENCAKQFSTKPGREGEPSPRQDAGKDYLDAVYWCTKASEKGDSRSQYLLTGLYEKGLGVAKNQQTALRWYKQSAEHGYADAQFRLGIVYGKGEGVPQDKIEATRWYTKAAQQGQAEAQLFMGYRHEHGKGVTQSYPEAWNWYLKSAAQGNATAMNYLGGMALEGRGVPQNHIEAYKWYNLAATTGEEQFTANRDKVVKKLSPRQLEEGQKSAEEWSSTHPAPWKSNYL